MKKVLVILVIINGLIVIKLKAQNWDIGVKAGGLSYIGDLNPKNPAKFNSGGLGIFLRKNITPYISVSGNFLFGILTGNDADSENAVLKERNLSFYTPIYEYSGQIELNFRNFVSGFEGKDFFSPYLFIGFGAIFFEPMRQLDGHNYRLRWYATEGQNISNPYNPVSLVIPVGFGAKYSTSFHWSIIGVLTYHYSFTNYLDDVNGSYPDPNLLYDDIARKLSDPSLSQNTKIGSQRGITFESDKYISLTIGIMYSIVDTDCRSVQFD